MKETLKLSTLVLLCISPLAHAEAYKCVQPNGSVAFQDHPCDAGATSSTITLPPPQSYPAQDFDQSGESEPSQGAESGGNRARARSGNSDNNERLAAENKALRCNAARHNLGVLKQLRPVYTTDSTGKRAYVENKDRASATAEAEQRVATECQQQ